MARRGENIRKRSDGRWEGRYIKGRSADGKPCWGYVYGATYTEVREISARKKAEYGIYNLNSTDITFSEISEQWLYSVQQGVKESTFAHYQYTLRHYLQPVFGDFKVSAYSFPVYRRGYDCPKESGICFQRNQAPSVTSDSSMIRYTSDSKHHKR